MKVLEHRYYKKSLGDFSGHSNHGTRDSADVDLATLSNIWCLQFGGSTSEVDCGSDSSLDLTGSYTVCALVSVESLGAEAAICGRYNDGTNRGFDLKFNTDGTITYHHTVQGSGEGSLLGNTTSSASSYDDGRFHWVVAKFIEGTGSFLYVDSLFVDSDTSRTDGITSFSQNFYIGRQSGGTPDRLPGYIAEVVVWNESLGEMNLVREMNKRRTGLSRRGDPSADSRFFLFSGQSLSSGIYGRPALSTKPRIGSTFANGPRSDFDELDYLIPLVENDNTGPDGNDLAGQTPCFSAANRAFMLGGYDIISSTVGRAAYSITQLNKGTDWYLYLLAHTEAAAKFKHAEGKSLSAPALAWIQGETDVTMAKETYKNYLIQYQIDVENDMKLITGQSEDILVITYQMSYYSRLFFLVPLAQYELDRDNSNFCISTPMYHFPYTDRVHLTNIGYMWLGHYFGKAFDAIIQGNTWHPLRPTSVTLDGKVFTVTFDVPDPPIVLDTTSIGLATNYGFAPRDVSKYLTVARVEVINSTQIEIEVEETVSSSPRVRYALDSLGAGLDIMGGASGNLRDSCSDYFIQNSTTYNLYNWCVHFEKYV